MHVHFWQWVLLGSVPEIALLLHLFTSLTWGEIVTDKGNCDSMKGITLKIVKKQVGV